MTAWQQLCIEATCIGRELCGSVPFCYDKLLLFPDISRTSSPDLLTDHTLNVREGVKIRKTGWLWQNVHSVSLQKCHSRFCERNNRVHHPASSAYSCYTNHHVYSIKMHISHVKFVPEFWQNKNSIILWKIKLDLVSEPSI